MARNPEAPPVDQHGPIQTTEILDAQFGRLRLEYGWGWCAKAVEWTPGLKVGLCIVAELAEDNAIPDCARAAFNTLRAREQEFVSCAARELFEAFNEIYSVYDEDSRPDGWPFDTERFAGELRLWWVKIDAEGESELQYITGGPLVHAIVTADLGFKEAYLDLML
jgi:hypothetical protein